MAGSQTAISEHNGLLHENETGNSPDIEFGTTSESAIFLPNDFGMTRTSRPMFPNLPTSVATSRRPSVIRLGSTNDITNEARQYDIINTDSDDEVASTTDQEATEASGEEAFEPRSFEPDDHYLHVRQPVEDFEGAGEGAGAGEDTAVPFAIGEYATTSRRELDSRHPTDDGRAGAEEYPLTIPSIVETGGVLGGLPLRAVAGTVGSGAVRPSDLPTVGHPVFRMFHPNRRNVGDETVGMRANRSSYPPQLPDARGRGTTIHLGRRHPAASPHWDRSNRLAQLSITAAATSAPRSGVSSAATTPRDGHFGLHSHSQHRLQRSVPGNPNLASANTAAATSLAFSPASPEGWLIVPRSNVALNGNHRSRNTDGPHASTLPTLTHFGSTSSDSDDEIGDCGSLQPDGWRASCKDSRARFKYVLESEVFADVCFLIGTAPRPTNPVSRRPSRVPTLSRQPTLSNDTADRKQRIISSMIAQVSGSVSRGQASPPNDAVQVPVDDEPTAADKAKRLTELLLAMNIEQSTTSESMLRPSEALRAPSLSLSTPSSSASSSPTSSLLTENEGQPSVAVMCDMTDTSDIDSDDRQVETVSTCTQTPLGALSYHQVPKARTQELGEGSEAAVAVATDVPGHVPAAPTLTKVDETVNGSAKKTVARPESPDSTSRMDFREGDQLQQQLPTRFYAHRLILALASPVFEAMFFGLFTENMGRNRYPASANGGNTRGDNCNGALSCKGDILELHISDVTPKAFRQCLQFIYYDDLQLSNDIDELYDILYAAKKYLLPQLASASASQLIKHMTPENVLFQLNKCSAIDEEELTQICWRTVDLMTSEVLASEPFVDLYKETVLELISRDTLCCEEWEIFEAVHRWASAECDRRGLGPTATTVADLMADFLPLIRFTTMSLGDFVLHVAKSGVLSLELQRDISVFIATKMFSQEELSKKSGDTNDDSPAMGGEFTKPVSSTNQPPTNMATSATPRSGPPLFRCLRSFHAMVPMSKEGYWQEPEAVAFEVSSTVFLAGIGVSEPVGRGSSLKLKIEVRRCSIRKSVRVESSARFQTVGVSTSVHRHSHQLHSVSTQSIYRPRPGDDSRRRMLRSGGGGGSSSSSYRPSLPPSHDQITSRGSGSLKLFVNRGHVLGQIETVIHGSGSRPVAQIRFPKPIMLKGGKTYVIIARPEEGRHTRCYVHMNVARTEVRVRTRHSKQGEKSPTSWFPLTVPKHVVFHFWYCDKSQINCSTEGNHIPEILFCPPT
uniref:BTB domain-containing protein n=1 Tax=Schistocephalus solidus TaxID=70667 RepID=A0A0X3PMQ4_SCHSO